MLWCGAGWLGGVHQCETEGKVNGLDGRGLCIVKFKSVLITVHKVTYKTGMGTCLGINY